MSCMYWSRKRYLLSDKNVSGRITCNFMIIVTWSSNRRLLYKVVKLVKRGSLFTKRHSINNNTCLKNVNSQVYCLLYPATVYYYNSIVRIMLQIFKIYKNNWRPARSNSKKVIYNTKMIKGFYYFLCTYIFLS